MEFPLAFRRTLRKQAAPDTRNRVDTDSQALELSEACLGSLWGPVILLQAKQLKKINIRWGHSETMIKWDKKKKKNQNIVKKKFVKNSQIPVMMNPTKYQKSPFLVNMSGYCFSTSFNFII